MTFPVEKQCRHLLKISFICGINSLHVSKCSRNSLGSMGRETLWPLNPGWEHFSHLRTLQMLKAMYINVY